MTEKAETKAVENEETRTLAEKQETGKKKRKSRKKKIFKRLIWTLVILLVLGVAGWSVVSRLQSEYRTTYDPYTATTGSISNSLSFTGSVQLIDSATYTASSDTKVREIYVSAGDRVKDGDKLIRMNGGETIEAEFDGTVSSIDVAKGDDVKSGDTLMTVADFDHMEVQVRVGESNIAQVAEGQKCRVTVASAGVECDSVIGKIDYVAYTGSNVAYYTTTVPIDAFTMDNVWPGMQATVTVTMDEAKDVTVLKMDALSTARDNTAFVYKENADGEMEQVPVTVGVSNGNYVEIREGVVSGETVYKVAEKTNEPTGLAALFSNAFSNTRVNRNTRNRNRNNQDGPPDFGNMPGNNPGGGNNDGGSRGR